MDPAVIGNESLVRFSAFAGIFIVLLALETLFPRRARSQPRMARWPSNLGIVVLNTLLLRLVFPLAAVGMAEIAAARGWGFFNIVDAPRWLAFVASFLLLDLAIWAQHVVLHKVPVFWRFHRVHHADLDLDVTSGLRFHPGEILLSMLYKMAVVVALGPAAVVVVAFEVKLNATAMWSHANLNLPVAVDRIVRLVLVTPDMHRVHHSSRPEETDSNYGFNFPWWDRLFGTYRAQPADGHAGMTVGLQYFRDAGELRLDKLLVQPLKSADQMQSL